MGKRPSVQRFFRQKCLTPFAALLLALVCAAGTAAVCLRPEPVPTDEQLYQAAVVDAVTIEPGEVLPLVTITPESDLATVKDGKVLLVTVNHHPERYLPGEAITLPDEVWTFTDREIAAWYAENKAGVTDWPLRLKQLVGVPPDGEYTHVSAMWVAVEDVRRPAYSTDITTADMPTALPESTPEEYRDWFTGNILWSYFDSAYPWTRLGYTYDWADNGTEYGLTEFWVAPGTQAEVAYTDTIAEFIDRLEHAA